MFTASSPEPFICLICNELGRAIPVSLQLPRQVRAVSRSREGSILEEPAQRLRACTRELSGSRRQMSATNARGGCAAGIELDVVQGSRGVVEEPYEGEPGCLPPGCRPDISRLCRDLLRLVEQQNAKVLGGNRKAIVTEQGLRPCRKRDWLQIKEGGDGRHQIDRGVQDGVLSMLRGSRAIFDLCINEHTLSQWSVNRLFPIRASLLMGGLAPMLPWGRCQL